MADTEGSISRNIINTNPVVETVPKGPNRIELLNKIFIVLIIFTVLVGLSIKSYIQGQAKTVSVKNENKSIILNETIGERVEVNSSASARVTTATPRPTPTPIISSDISTFIPTSAPTPLAQVPTPTFIVASSSRPPTLGGLEISANALYVNSTLVCSPDSARKIAAGVWDFGDGATYTFQILDSGYASSPGKTESITTGHGYISSGTYIVTGKCKDDLGILSLSVSKSITVSQNQAQVNSPVILPIVPGSQSP
jgi:hypothetical protein